MPLAGAAAEPGEQVSGEQLRGAVKADPLPESASLLLDGLRFGLCLLVLLGHMSQSWFSSGWPDFMGLANGAVPGFFVLSGFVIRFVTATREREARRYWVSRASRIYSVVVPAIVLTIVLDAISRHVNPAFYGGVFLPTPWPALPVRVGANLVFLTQVWGRAVLLLSNISLWSLGYEVPYYVLFGVAAFTRGGLRVALLLGFAVLFGPQVLFLLPVWWSGIWLYDLWQWSRSGRASGPARLAVILGAAAAAAALLVRFNGRDGFDRVASLHDPLLLLHQSVVRASMFEYAAGLLSFALMLLALCATDLIRLPKKTRAARAVRFVAEGTFTLYLFHYPMLMFAAALGLYRHGRTGDKVAVMLAIAVLSIAAAVPIDGLKRWLRDRMGGWGRRRAAYS